MNTITKAQQKSLFRVYQLKILRPATAAAGPGAPLSSLKQRYADPGDEIAMFEDFATGIQAVHYDESGNAINRSEAA